MPTSLIGVARPSRIELDNDDDTVGLWIAPRATSTAAAAVSAVAAISAFRTDTATVISTINARATVAVRPAAAEYRPEDFGAQGDDTADDTVAFQAMATTIQALPAGCAVVTLTAGKVYRVGRQTLAGNTTSNGSYLPAPIVKLTGMQCLIINGNGATLKYNDGLRIGTFDPVTGALYGTVDVAIASTGPNQKYVAQLGSIIEVYSTDSVTIRDLTVEGNDTAAIKGGGIGNAGTTDYSGSSYGILLYWVTSVAAENCRIHHVPVDGLIIEGNSTTSNTSGYRVILTACEFTYCGRNNLTLGGTANVAINGCSFNHGGRGAFYTGPGSGIDFETYYPVMGRSAIVSSCEFVNNRSRCYSNSAGWSNITFSRCIFRTDGALGIVGAVSGSNVTHEDCSMYGLLDYYGEDAYDPDGLLKPDTGTTFRRCRFEDLDYVQPVVLLDNAGIPTLQVEAVQRYGASTTATTVTILNSGTPSRWRIQISYGGVLVRDIDNLNTVKGALSTLNGDSIASQYVVFADLGSPSTNPTVDPAPITGVTLPVTILDRSLIALVANPGDNTVFEECTFIPHKVLAFNMGDLTVTHPVTLRRCTIVTYNSSIADKGSQSTLRNVILDDVKWIEPPGLTPPVNGWYIGPLTGTVIGPGGVTVGPNIRWAAWNGRTGIIRNPQTPQMWGPFIPSVAYSQGDLVTNSGHLYAAITNFTATGSFVGTDWTQLI
jgi:hypothetical protein